MSYLHVDVSDPSAAISGSYPFVLGRYDGCDGCLCYEGLPQTGCCQGMSKVSTCERYQGMLAWTVVNVMIAAVVFASKRRQVVYWV